MYHLVIVTIAVMSLSPCFAYCPTVIRGPWNKAKLFLRTLVFAGSGDLVALESENLFPRVLRQRLAFRCLAVFDASAAPEPGNLASALASEIS